MKTYTPEALRKNLFELLNKVANDDEKIEVPLNRFSDSNKGVILISKDRYRKLEELDFLHRTGALAVVMNRMENAKPDDFSEKNAY
ncbi:prevent-host-death protein [Lacticaseibacillus zeae]|uniref:Prevent-host-death protein n=1 Tax=Lacticaseibacillus zeae TaxID=57037 RepID=A0A5R8LQQ8_LACZE|nr:prevent-host-death protein [Lacticaseibacillus zeae]TLF39557.1 prevent-host-death protein [Lacticaseibacillus zeae]